MLTETSTDKPTIQFTNKEENEPHSPLKIPPFIKLQMKQEKELTRPAKTYGQTQMKNKKTNNQKSPKHLDKLSTTRTGEGAQAN